MENNETFEVTIKSDIPKWAESAFGRMSEDEKRMLMEKVSAELYAPDLENAMLRWLGDVKRRFEPAERYIDLGLPSGTLWADRNYGASDGFSTADALPWQSMIVEDTSMFPSSDDFKELIDNTDHKFVTNYKKSGSNGMVFKSRVNGNEIFLTANGGLYNCITDTIDHKLSGHYYTKTPCAYDQSRYNTLYFNQTVIGAYVDISKKYNSQLRTIKK